MGLWIRYTIGSPSSTVSQALITASARLDVNEFAILGLENKDKFVRPEIIRPSLENYTNLFLGLGG